MQNMRKKNKFINVPSSKKIKGYYQCFHLYSKADIRTEVLGIFQCQRSRKYYLAVLPKTKLGRYLIVYNLVNPINCNSPIISTSTSTSTNAHIRIKVETKKSSTNWK